jgi:hypothetical protein
MLGKKGEDSRNTHFKQKYFLNFAVPLPLFIGNIYNQFITHITLKFYACTTDTDYCKVLRSLLK